MRYYKILIDGTPIFELNENNPNACRIVCELKNFESAEVPNAIISIYNVGISFLGSTSKLIGKRFELRAGIKQTSLTKKMGITPILNDLIAFGYIQQVTSNPNLGVNNQVMFLLRTSSQEADKPVLFELKGGQTAIKDALATALRGLYKESLVQVQGISIIAPYSVKLKMGSYYDLSAFAKKHKISILKTTGGYLIDDEKTQIPTNLRILKPQDFLEKPSQVQIAKIQGSLHLRGDLQLSTYIEIPTKMFATIPSDIRSILNKPVSYIQGRYKLVKIWHILDSRNVGSQSWTTNFEAIKEAE